MDIYSGGHKQLSNNYPPLYMKDATILLNYLRSSVYEPQEDSYLLQEYVKKYASGRVLDMGTGSGIQAFTAAKCKKVKEVVAVDINEEALKKLAEKKTSEKIRKIKLLSSDLFSNFKGPKSKFDTIIFNPPYLPQDVGIEDIALYGGKKGWEISERFFKEASNFLVLEGKILFLFSSHTNKNKIDEIIRNHLFEFKEIGRQRLPFFEELYVYLVEKSELLKELEQKGVKEIGYLAKGCRGVVFSGFWKKRRVVIKAENQESTAVGRIQNEIKWLKRLNKKKIGPKLYFYSLNCYGKNYFVCAYVEGKRLLEWLREKNSGESEINAIRIIIISILKQCWVMDELGVSKMEMHHPRKHIIISNFSNISKKSNNNSSNRSNNIDNKIAIPVQIDFERCREMAKPLNVTQFVEFLCRIKSELESKGLHFEVNELRALAKDYKIDFGKKKLENIINYLAK